jgi:hypothetical protein
MKTIPRSDLSGRSAGVYSRYTAYAHNAAWTLYRRVEIRLGAARRTQPFPGANTFILGFSFYRNAAQRAAALGNTLPLHSAA